MLAGLMLSASFDQPKIVQAALQSAVIAETLTDADLIVVARILGLVDPNPAARARKHLEAHWIFVEETLHGSDESGQSFRARPNGLAWEDGKSYILFLSRINGDWVEADPRQLLQATETAIRAVTQGLAEQGGGLSPRRAVWMRHTGPWGTGVLAEFFVTVDGDFEWKKRAGSGWRTERKHDTRSGRLSQDAIRGLIERIARAAPGPAADDAGRVSFRWLDPAGEAQSKGCNAGSQSPSAELVKTIEALVLKYGREPQGLEH